MATIGNILGLNLKKRVLFAGAKSVFWNLFCIFFGLLQLLAIYVIAKIRGDAFNLNDTLRNGVILFFCSAFMFTSVIDCMRRVRSTLRQIPYQNNNRKVVDYFSGDYRYSTKEAEWFFMIFIPLGMVFFILILYTSIFRFPENIDMTFLGKGTALCFAVTVIHAIVFRAIRIYKSP